MQGVHPVRHDLQGVYVQAAVRLVEDGEDRFQHRHLEDLAALLFAAGESDVHLPAGEFRPHLEQGHLLFHPFQEGAGVQGRSSGRFLPGRKGCLQEVLHRYAGNLHRILERQEQSRPGTFLRFHREEVPAQEGDASAGHLVVGFSGEDGGQGALPRAVGPHDGVDLSPADFQVDPAEDLLPAGGGGQPLDFQQ